jgi:GT2 family glycosyltransferase
MSSITSIVAVVLNWCAENDSTRAIQSLLMHGGPGVTVLVVDNASPDGSGPRLHARFPELPYLQTGANLGYAGGNQRAIEWALAREADAVLLVNDDAELRPGCLPALREAMAADARLGACAPTVVHGPPHEDRVWWGGGHFGRRTGCGMHHHAGEALNAVQEAHPEPLVPVTAVNGCVMLLRSEALRAVGGLDESYFCYNEDTELTLRLNAGGWSTAWLPHAVAVHHLPFPEPRASPWAITQLDRNRRRLAARHLTTVPRAAFAARFYPTRLLLMVNALLRGDGDRATAYWKGMTTSLSSSERR